MSTTGPSSSNQFTRIKKRLVSLVGTDVIRLNDRYYIEKLIAGLSKEQHAHEEKREKELAEAELERLRTLKLRGVIPDDSPLTKPKHPSCSKKRKKKKRRPKTADACKADTESRFQLESYMTMKRRLSQPERRWSADNRRLGFVDTVSKSDSQTIQDSDDDEISLNQTPAHKVPNRQHNRHMHEPEILCKLREAETVARLYEIADHLVGKKPKPKPQIFVIQDDEEEFIDMKQITPCNQ